MSVKKMFKKYGRKETKKFFQNTIEGSNFTKSIIKEYDSIYLLSKEFSLKKINVSATFLALAGLNRLKVVDVPIFPINIEEMLPAVAQGAIGVERRVEDNNVAYLLHRINDSNTEECMRCERAYLKKLDGSCQSPIAGIATLEGGNINFKAEILTPDGIKKFTAQGSDPTAVAGTTHLYAKTEAGGGTGLFYVNTSSSGELVSKAKAQIFGLIF